jgi:hypothetical protein
MKRMGRIRFIALTLAIVAMVQPSAPARNVHLLRSVSTGPVKAISKPVNVFILMGQSNMLGLGAVGPVRLKKTLEYAVTKEHRYGFLVNKMGRWKVSKTVRLVFVLPGRLENQENRATFMNQVRHGFSTHGMTVKYNQWLGVNGHRFIGPEFGISEEIKKVVHGPVLLLKSCNGNRSIGWDLLPPGSKGYLYTDKRGRVWQYAGYGQSPMKWLRGTPKNKRQKVSWYAGKEYDMDVANAKYVLAHLSMFYPGATGYKIAGFFFWQGDKDRYDAGLASHYEANLTHFIQHVRKDFNAPDAPFVLATLGQDIIGVTKGNDGMVLRAQLAVADPAKHPQFKGNVATVYTHPLSKGGASNSHYNGNAQTYMDVGLSMGKAMDTLLTRGKTAGALTPRGEKLMNQYSAILRNVRRTLYAALPSMDPGMRKPFMAAFRAEAAAKPYRDTNRRFTKAVAHCQRLAAPILDMASAFLSSDQYDTQLIKASIIADATARGLAMFAEKSRANEMLIHTLLTNPALMRQMQMADGARHGNYGLTMRIYTAIEHASTLARHGILQRLALATALSQKPHLTFRNQPTYNPVTRYLDYQRAYIKGELDPAFPTFSTWQCRYIIDEPYDNHEINWVRTMLQNYAPNMVLSGQYLNIVHTDVGYCHPHPGLVPGNVVAQEIAGGGECGIRAWVGRVAERAFGIPVWGVRQRGHAALTHWAPNGWVTPLGAGWNWNWWDHRLGLDFYLETQARRYPHRFMKVLRAQWIGATLGEKQPDGVMPGTGGLWYAVANCQAREIVASGKPRNSALNEHQLLVRYGPTEAEKIQSNPVERSAFHISVSKQGIIHIPAVACSWPTGTVRGILFTKSFLGGMQLHYYKFVHTRRFGKKEPLPLKYTINLRRGGRYELTAMVVTVKPPQHLAVFVNHGVNCTDITVPWTNGLWQKTAPVTVRLKRGINIMTIGPASNFFAVSIKNLSLAPMK